MVSGPFIELSLHPYVWRIKMWYSSTAIKSKAACSTFCYSYKTTHDWACDLWAWDEVGARCQMGDFDRWGGHIHNLDLSQWEVHVRRGNNGLLKRKIRKTKSHTLFRIHLQTRRSLHLYQPFLLGLVG